MTIEQRKWVGQLGGAQYAAPLLPFASFPAALTVEGQIRRPEELPHVSLIALSGLWRPLGGRQVLASRVLNPVTIQDLTANGTLAERIGPFPGGMVRAGMQLVMFFRMAHGAVGNVNRGFWLRAGPAGGAHGINQSFSSTVSALTNTGAVSSAIGSFDVLVDGAGAHRGYLNGNAGITFNGAPYTPTIDFSQPWDAAIYLISGAETAVTITGATWSAGVATYTTSANHTLAVGDKDVISGITPSGYNGTFIVSAVGSPTTFSVPMAANPGTYTSGGSSARTSNVISQSYELALMG